ncbi:DNA phosphorothioation-dependent restriction protein DptH [Salirhabdus sp. Marseille-P4669]|uniref:DNA phosphorothioation-dependent restriction protein DptH n=1 Tax=Salirhabdus sp. Marseille-P4669 TaxID=2042310 RepID=UPI001F1C7790|nr:DNA phosphorothioation-dependent restriction protein DptH [Salirhabdus sp. Marseille-P4669]
MLNEFYNYMAKKLITFLKDQNVQRGERFYLQFDEEKHVQDFYATLMDMPEAEIFEYQHEKGSPYKTFAIKVGKVKVVVGATINDITPDFLVTIRNLVSEQEGKWERTALIVISHLSLDSIQGGSKNLQQKGMPFNIQSITDYIKEELDYNEVLSTAEKEIIKFHLDRKLEEFVIQTSIWDYAEVISLINKGTIEEKDFKELYLFPDKELGKDSYIKPSDIRARLQENNRLFEQVKRIHDYETFDTEFEGKFDEKMIPKLKRDDWYQNQFAPVREAHNNVKKALGYISSETKKLNKHVAYWERPHADTKAGNRKRHIIVFNDKQADSIEMQFEFDDFLRKQFVNQLSEKYTVASGKKLKVTLPTTEEIDFYQIKYKHNKENQSAYEFNFCIVPFSMDMLEGIEPFFEVRARGSEKGLFLKYQGEKISIGSGENVVEHTINEAYETIHKEENQQLLLDVEAGAWDDDSLSFTIEIHDLYLQFQLKDTDTKAYPIQPKRVWKLKRERQEHFYLENDRLRAGTNTYYLYEDYKAFLLLEQDWVEKNYYYMNHDEIVEDFQLPDAVRETYDAYLDYFRKQKRIPSLSYMDKELMPLARDYVEAVKNEIQAIEEHSLLRQEQKNLFKLGTIVSNGKIWLSPLHPLNVAYQLNLTSTIQDEELDNPILDRLHPQNLLPFLYSQQDELYRPSMDAQYAEWYKYEPEKLITVGTANEFLANVVEEKIKQYISHFDYLFLESANSPLLLNIIEIHNDKEVVRGIFSFLKKRLEANGRNGLIPIEVALYRDNVESISSFELLSTLQTPAEIEAEFNINLSSKEFDSVDVLRMIRENIHYFKNDLTPDTEFQYAHISFFKLPNQDIDASHEVHKMETGIALNGLLSSVVSISSGSDYRSGFGLLNAPTDSTNSLVDIAACYNELSYNMQNEGKNSYSKNKSIVMSTSTEAKSLLERLYQASSWVTFIDPGVDLDFFQKSSQNLLVIHYNDQHTSSDRYDAITVTNKSNQYKKVITDYIKEKVSVTPKNIDLAIKSFNSINGEWLLSIIGSKGHLAREKISLVAAMKFLENYLYHPNITWIPVSLEEILRVASAIKLTKSEGIFSTKNLSSSGKHSDDILMMGVEKIEEQLFLHFYPVEVKIGRLQTKKANIQIKKTTKLFKTFLVDEPGEASFKKSFYRNFFAQILLSNAKKLHSNGLWSDEKYEGIHALKPKLLNDDFYIGQHLEGIIGQSAVLTFRKDHGFRSAHIEDNTLKLTFIEEDAYVGLATDMEEILDKMQKGYMDFVPEKMLFTMYEPANWEALSEQIDHNEEILDQTSNEATILDEENDEFIEEDSVNGVQYQIEEEHEIAAEDTTNYVTGSTTDTEETQTNSEPKVIEAMENDTNYESDSSTQGIELENIRIPIGKLHGSNHMINWEFGNPGLPNRHLFITGRSGQGKTYFIQCLLAELAQHGISSMIIDYTDGFKSSQLEDEFKENLGDNLEQFIVLAKKFPVNPFKRNLKELDVGVTVKEDDSDVAERIKNVISSIYTTLGPQQLNSIYQAVMKGMSLHDEQMNLRLLRDYLEEDGSGPAKTALSQMNLLIDKNPFEYKENFDWSFLEKEKGKVFIVQLTGYTPDVQKMITEFILWDLWYYKLQHGNKNLPFPVILDESQRLDFSGDSPSSKILVEGRKFGWSGWFATQFLKGGFSTDQVNRLQNAAMKIYFAPMENEVSSIASNITQDASERKEWEARLNNLKKGQCIVYGPVLDKNGDLLPSKPYLVDIVPFGDRD